MAQPAGLRTIFGRVGYWLNVKGNTVFGFKRKTVSDPQYERQGYKIFSQTLNADAVRNAIEAIKQEVFPHAGALLRHPTGRVEPHRFAGPPEPGHIVNQLLNPHQAQQTLPLTSTALLDLICSRELTLSLNQLDGNDEYTVHQVILFFMGPAMDIHVDGWFLDTAPHGYAHTVWIPLEDLTIHNGPICVYPTPRARFIDAKELGLGDIFGARDDESLTRYHKYQNALLRKYRESQSAVVVPQMRPRDFAVWTSLTPHGSFPAREGTSRLSMQVLIRPSSYQWGRFEDILVEGKPRQDQGTLIRPGWRLQ